MLTSVKQLTGVKYLKILYLQMKKSNIKNVCKVFLHNSPKTLDDKLYYSFLIMTNI